MISVHRSTACREDIAGRLVRSQLIISCECCFNYVYMFYIGRHIKQISPTEPFPSKCLLVVNQTLQIHILIIFICSVLLLGINTIDEWQWVNEWIINFGVQQHVKKNSKQLLSRGILATRWYAHTMEHSHGRAWLKPGVVKTRRKSRWCNRR